jgi:hypothetical protein
MDGDQGKPQLSAGLMRALAVGVLVWAGVWWLVR